MKTFTFFILVVAALIPGFSGCTDNHKSVSGCSGGAYVVSDIENGGGLITENIKFSSRAFKQNASIPKKYSCDGEDINPDLGFVGMPEEAESLVLIMDDPDAPGGTFTHWLAWGIDPASGIAEAERLGTEGMNDFGKVGYGGPCPPRGTPHRYFFRLYALDTELALEEGASRKEFEAAMAEHVLSEGELMGRYGRA